MNIFYLDQDPVKSARAHGDKHIVKMPLETAQMLSTVWHLLGEDEEVKSNIYKATHITHPCTQWVATNKKTYGWTYRFYVALCQEFEFRRGKIHASYGLSRYLSLVPCGLTEGKFIAPPQCMPDQFTIETDPKVGQVANTSNPETTCHAYRNYYQYKFDLGIAEYNWCRGKPDWITMSQMGMKS